MTYQHIEAFAHITYRADDGSQTLTVWNSRDGVTPFSIRLPSGKPATHVDWRHDRPDPGYVPALGDWIFVDLTPERAGYLARRNAERFWADPNPEIRAHAHQAYGSVDQLADTLADSYLERPGEPDLVQVTDDLRAQFLHAKEALTP